MEATKSFARNVGYVLISFKYSTAHLKYDIIVYHKSESVTSFMHKWLHVLLNGQPIEMKCSYFKLC